MKKYQREIVISPKRIGVGACIAGLILGGYFSFKSPKQAVPDQILSQEYVQPQKENVTLDQPDLYTILNDLNPGDYIRLIPAEKRKLLAKKWLSDLTLAEKVEVLKPLMEDGIINLLAEFEKGVTPKIPTITYPHHPKRIDRPAAAARLLNILRGT